MSIKRDPLWICWPARPGISKNPHTTYLYTHTHTHTFQRVSVCVCVVDSSWFSRKSLSVRDFSTRAHLLLLHRVARSSTYTMWNRLFRRVYRWLASGWHSVWMTAVKKKNQIKMMTMMTVRWLWRQWLWIVKPYPCRWRWLDDTRTIRHLLPWRNGFSTSIDA